MGKRHDDSQDGYRGDWLKREDCEAAVGLLPARLVCARYQIVIRTLDRWIADERLGFPRPVIVNTRRYFPVGELVRWERERATNRTAQSAA